MPVAGELKTTPGRPRASHLMCGTPFWGIAAAVACAYFAYSAYSQLREGDVYWKHGFWILVTWGVWILLIAGLLSEARCWRERIFFGLLLANFLLGFVLAAWTRASESLVGEGREISLGLWTLAALASLLTVNRSPQSAPAVKS
jgi:hypothetical protein